MPMRAVGSTVLKVMVPASVSFAWMISIVDYSVKGRRGAATARASVTLGVSPPVKKCS